MYDAIIVGARIAGSATARLLAQKGYRVLLLDRAKFPSSTASSTNLIHPPGVLRLKRWGILDRLGGRASTPITHYALRSGQAELLAALPTVDEIDHALSPARAELDHALVCAATDSGVELREGVSVQDLLFEHGQVVGVRGTAKDVGTFAERAKIVIGADGKNSRIAQRVGAVRYREQPVLSKSYWTYWDGLPHDGIVRTYRQQRRHSFTWPTHDGLTIVGVAWPTHSFPARDDENIDRNVIDSFADVDPGFAAQLRENHRVDRWLTGAVPNFLRTPQGPGWALVGDAATTRDPITASGVTYALLEAEALANLLEEGLSERSPMAVAMAEYERIRDNLVIDHYDYTCDYARIDDHSAEERALIAAMNRSPWHGRAMVGLFATIVPPAHFYVRSHFRELFGYLDPNFMPTPKLRFVRWLLEGVPGRPSWSASMADRLIATQLGQMGRLLLRSSPTARPLTTTQATLQRETP